MLGLLAGAKKATDYAPVAIPGPEAGLRAAVAIDTALEDLVSTFISQLRPVGLTSRDRDTVLGVLEPVYDVALEALRN